MTRTEMTVSELDELADRAAPLDALLVDAALGPMRRLAPNSSTVRFAARLARDPAWSQNPFLRRAVQAYLAPVGRSMSWSTTPGWTGETTSGCGS